MRVRKEERLGKFRAVKAQIHKISVEIAGQPDDVLTSIVVNENDLSLKKLEEYQTQLQRLYTEKVLLIKHLFLFFLRPSPPPQKKKIIGLKRYCRI